MGRAFIVHDCEQRSPEWTALRVGRLTGSVAAEMCATRKDKKEAADRRNLKVRLALERMTKRPQERAFQSQAMKDGAEREVDACGLYEAVTGNVLHTSGFLEHTSLMAGCSLDGHVGDFDGIAECKCPLAATHMDYLRTGRVPDDYIWQVRHNLWMTGAAWCDWLSFHPDFPEPLRIKLVRVERVEAEMDSYELILSAFLKEVDQVYAEIARMALVEVA